MALATRSAVIVRRRALIELLSAGEHTVDHLRRMLPGRPSRRTLGSDLAWIQRTVNSQIHRNRLDGHVHWRLSGRTPHLLDLPLDLLTADEVIALVAARSLLRLPDANAPQLDRRQQPPGPLAQAIDHLIGRCGLTQEVAHLAPEVIMASRHGVAREPPAVFPLVLEAILRQQAVRFTYENNRNERKAVHVQPQRLVTIHGSWHCFAWSPDVRTPPGRIKQYHLSRIAGLSLTTTKPPRLPIHIPTSAIDDCLHESFGATGSHLSADRRRIVLAVSPEAWPHLRDRTWGSKQDVQENQPGLPPGWRRLSFTTTGLQEARHRILGLGRTVRAEKPPELVAWLHAEAQAVLDAHQPQVATVSANTRVMRRPQP
ncbi:MAG: WYL domain-containing protein [Planctomycetes bacterium]|nr:WYL domain-containing protein [Planctomycetota bacterium]